MNWILLLVFKIPAIFYTGHFPVHALIPVPPISSTSNPSVPQYRFHYYVKDEKTGDYKAQEEHRTGNSVTGSYMVGEPNGDLRVVTYIADVSSGFKADVSVHPGGSPLKNTTSNVSKEGIAGFNNYRSGISAPPKIRKPVRGFNPIVVKSLTSFGGQTITSSTSQTASSTPTTPSGHPYPYFKDEQPQQQNTSIDSTLSSSTAKKFVQVDLTFNDDTVVEQNEKDTVLPQHRKSELTSTEGNFVRLFSYTGEETTNTVKNTATAASFITSNNGLYQLRNMDIPSSVMEILNQNKVKSENLTHATTSSPTTFITTQPSTDAVKPSEASEPNQEIGSLKIDLTRGVNENANFLSESSTAGSAKKVTIPQRPMRLIGLSPIFVDTSQLQTITENLTSLPQLHFEPFTNMQYATPAPFHSGPLQGGPAGPFRNLPRSITETNGEFSLINAVPIVNSIPISAPIISQQFAAASVKPDVKLDNKIPAHPLSLCSDCLLPANYVPYPLVKAPTLPVNNNNQKTPCPPNNAAAPPYWAPYVPSFAYVLVPAPVIKSKTNETRSFATGQDTWRK